MKLLKKGKPGRVWRGSCRKCQAKFEDTEANVARGKIERCPRERYEFAQRDCPECGAKAGFAVILYPVANIKGMAPLTWSADDKQDEEWQP